MEKNETIKFDIQLITNDKQTIYYYPCFEHNDEIKKIIFDFSKKDNLDIELKQIEVKYDTSPTIILIRFMNKILEMETNEPKLNYGNYIFNKIDTEEKAYRQYRSLCRGQEGQQRASVRRQRYGKVHQHKGHSKCLL